MGKGAQRKRLCAGVGSEGGCECEREEVEEAEEELLRRLRGLDILFFEVDVPFFRRGEERREGRMAEWWVDW